MSKKKKPRMNWEKTIIVKIIKITKMKKMIVDIKAKV